MSEHPKSDWEAPKLWRQQIERRLHELGSMAKGNPLVVADRMSDLIEQIDELRKEVARLSERLDKAGEVVREMKKGMANRGE